MNQKKISTIEKYYYAIFLSVFIFGGVIRRSFLPSFLGTANLIFYLCMMLILANAVKLNRINWKSLVVEFLLITSIVIINMHTGSPVRLTLVTLAYSVFPLLVLDADLFCRINKKRFIYVILTVLNFFMISNFVIMFIDQVAGCIITKSMSEIFTGIKDYMSGTDLYGFLQFRAFTFLGHPLYIKHLLLMFYVLNMLYNRCYKKWLVNPIIIYIVSILGITFTQSKTGAVLLAFSIIYFNFSSRNRIVKIMLLIFAVLALYYVGAFDGLISRFTSTSLTSGRFYWLSFLKDKYGIQMKFIGGYGDRLSNDLVVRLSVEGTYFSDNASMVTGAAFECPAILFAYRYGILISLLWLVKMYGKVFRGLKNKKLFPILIAILIVVIDTMTFNALLYTPDMMICVIIWNVILCCFKDEIRTRTHRTI